MIIIIITNNSNNKLCMNNNEEKRCIQIDDFQCCVSIVERVTSIIDYRFVMFVLSFFFLSSMVWLSLSFFALLSACLIYPSKRVYILFPIWFTLWLAPLEQHTKQMNDQSRVDIYHWPHITNLSPLSVCLTISLVSL